MRIKICDKCEYNTIIYDISTDILKRAAVVIEVLKITLLIM